MGERLAAVWHKLKQYPVAAAASLAAVALVLALFFRSSTLTEREQELVETEAEWERIDANLKRSRNIEAHLESLESLRTEIEGRLLNPWEVAINYDYFYQLERETGVRLVVLSQTGVIDPRGRGVPGLPELKQYAPVGYTVAVEGTFPEVLRFLSQTANGRFFVRVSTMNLSNTNRLTGTVSANLQCQILGEK